MLADNVLILVPGRNARGGITNYYSSLRPHFPGNIKYLPRGSRNWPKRKNTAVEACRLSYDFIKYTWYLLFYKIKLVQITTAFSLNSIKRDSLYLSIAHFLRKKTVVFFRGWDENSCGIFEERNCYKRIFFMSDAIIDLRQSNIKQLQNWGYRNKTYLETTVVDNEIIKYIKDLNFETKYKNKSDNFFTILFLARIEKRKGIYEAINTFEHLRDKFPHLKLVIAGDGGEEAAAKKYCEEKSLKDVVFKGFVSGSEKAQCFIESDIYLFPSYSEGMPSSVLEAMSFGLPVVTTNVGGLSDFFINGKHGLIVEKNDPSILCDCISYIIDNNLMYSIAINNYQIAKELFYPKRVSERILKIFGETLSYN